MEELSSITHKNETLPCATADESDANMHARDLGNKAYREGNIDQALQHWDRGIRSCQYVLAKDVYDGEQKKEVQQFLFLLYVNMSAGYLKTGGYHSCIDMCDRALKLDPTCIKALYRKAEAYFHLSRYKEVTTVLNDLLELEPDNLCARNLKARNAVESRTFRAKEKKMMRKVFSVVDQMPHQTAGSFSSCVLSWCSQPRQFVSRIGFYIRVATQSLYRTLVSWCFRLSRIFVEKLRFNITSKNDGHCD